MKKLIIFGAVGILSFALSFGGGMFLWPSEEAEVVSEEAVAVEDAAKAEDANEVGAVAVDATLLAEESGRLMSEKELRGLIYEVKEKITEYEEKLSSLKIREERLAASSDVLVADIKKLEDLHIDVTQAVSQLKEEKRKLEETKTAIGNIESRNLTNIAATYDKMDPASASDILIEMSQQSSGSSAQGEDAVKILYFMSDRTKAKVLSELAGSQPKLAAYFSQRLKTVVVEN